MSESTSKNLFMPDQPLVSVIIPTRNRSELLERAIESVLEQTWDNLEIIVVDDASDDDTSNLLARYAEEDYPVRVIRNEQAKGASASRNIAIRNAEGEYIAGLDDDDYWRPKRIEKLMEEFDEEFSAVCSHDRMDFGSREVVWKKKPVITLDDLLYYNQVGNQVLTKKQYLLDAGGYDEALPSAQDYDLWIRLAHDFGPIKTAPHTLQVVNMNPDEERITTSDDQTTGYIACYEKHEPKMGLHHKKYQIYRIKLAEGKKVGWIEMLRSVPRHLLLKEVTRKLFL
jgi:glycosyltransferase involved in cell wall biosynthesis